MGSEYSERLQRLKEYEITTMKRVNGYIFKLRDYVKRDRMLHIKGVDALLEQY